MTPVQVDACYQAIQGRPRPEDVAALLLECLHGTLNTEEYHMLQRAGQHSWNRQITSMMQDFSRPMTYVSRQVSVAGQLFSLPPPSLTDGLDAANILAFVHTAKILMTADGARGERLVTKTARRSQGIYKNARWYNKRWRVLARIEAKLRAYLRNQRKYEYTRVGKSALAIGLTKDELAEDANTTALLAYLSARMSLRSTFTNTSQVRAFDTIAEMLLSRCERSETTRWDLLASLMPDPRILRRLDEPQQGQLLGRWWLLLQGMAEMLEEVWQQTSFDLTHMVVQRGQDSSTWNQVAGGWNMARSHWFSLLHALRFESILDMACPGKVMRLMAADVATWHQMSGGDVHPDTKVWSQLPPPWRVLRGDAVCTRADVAAACLAVGVPPETWLDAKPDRSAVAFTPTPELVHGVEVTSPTLATLLRKAGYFSGQHVKRTVDVIIQYDQYGMAVKAEDPSALAQAEQPARSPVR